jgi:hypothetical protein
LLAAGNQCLQDGVSDAASAVVDDLLADLGARLIEGKAALPLGFFVRYR